MLIVLVSYPAAAIVLGLTPVNTDFRQSNGSLVVYVRGNAAHTDIVVPHIHSFHDWRGEFPQAESDAWRPFISFSWGDRGFFQETPRWADLRASVAFVALSGLGRAAMRVEFADWPAVEYGDVVLRLSPAQYRRLVESIRASFQRTPDGRALSMPAPSYAAGASYFEATGSYSLLRTCNDWTRQKLAAAGVRMPIWSPFPPAIFYQLQQIPKLQR